MALWIDLKLGKEGNPKPLIEVHMDDIETVAQLQDQLQHLAKAFGLG